MRPKIQRLLCVILGRRNLQRFSTEDCIRWTSGPTHQQLRSIFGREGLCSLYPLGLLGLAELQWRGAAINQVGNRHEGLLLLLTTLAAFWASWPMPQGPRSVPPVPRMIRCI